jgi:hypothetical protein
MIVASMMIGFGFFVIMMYENLILGNSWSDRSHDVEVVGETPSMDLEEL